MSLRSVMHTYFRNWDIGSITTCGTSHGKMIIHSNETSLAIFFNLNGKTHWAYEEVTVDHIEAYD